MHILHLPEDHDHFHSLLADLIAIIIVKGAVTDYIKVQLFTVKEEMKGLICHTIYTYINIL